MMKLTNLLQIVGDMLVAISIFVLLFIGVILI